MTSWTDFATAQPELARRIRLCFAIRKHATVATLRRDGSPRISGTEVDFADDGLYLADDAHRVAVDVLEVVHTTVGTPADHLVIESGHADRGLQRRERR